MSEAVKISSSNPLVNYFHAVIDLQLAGKGTEEISTIQCAAAKKFLTQAGFDQRMQKDMLATVERLAGKVATLGGSEKASVDTLGLMFEKGLSAVKGVNNAGVVHNIAKHYEDALDLKIKALPSAVNALDVASAGAEKPNLKIEAPEHNGKGLMSLIKRKPLVSAAVGAGVLAAGGFAMSVLNKRSEAENQPKQI